MLPAKEVHPYTHENFCDPCIYFCDTCIRKPGFVYATGLVITLKNNRNLFHTSNPADVGR